MDQFDKETHKNKKRLHEHVDEEVPTLLKRHKKDDVAEKSDVFKSLFTSDQKVQSEIENGSFMTRCAKMGLR